MAWRGTLRTINAAANRAERDSKRRQRELQAQYQSAARMQEFEHAQYEVAVYENKIDVLGSLHKESSAPWDWQQIAIVPAPATPAHMHRNKARAQKERDAYRPGLLDKLFKRTGKNIARLDRDIVAAQEQDARDHRAWEEDVEMAHRILAGEEAAYLEALDSVAPFAEIAGLGSVMRYNMLSTDVVEASLEVNGEHVVPKQVKSLLKSGKMSSKPMTKTRFYEIYQDYVCSCALRVGREFFAVLPVKVVIFTALGELLNKQTGHLESQPVLSVALVRETFQRLNYDHVDPSDSMGQFVHEMKFSKTTGFSPVIRLDAGKFL